MSKPTRDEIARVVQLLDERGITLIRGDRFYGDELTPEAVLYFLEHELDEFMAWNNGMTREQYWSYMDFIRPEFCRCRGTTREGKRCRNRVDGETALLSNPSRFQPGISDRCPLHQEPGVTKRWEPDEADSPFHVIRK